MRLGLQDLIRKPVQQSSTYRESGKVAWTWSYPAAHAPRSAMPLLERLRVSGLHQRHRANSHSTTAGPTPHGSSRHSHLFLRRRIRILSSRTLVWRSTKGFLPSILGFTKSRLLD